MFIGREHSTTFSKYRRALTPVKLHIMIWISTHKALIIYFSTTTAKWTTQKNAYNRVLSVMSIQTGKVCTHTVCSVQYIVMHASSSLTYFNAERGYLEYPTRINSFQEEDKSLTAAMLYIHSSFLSVQQWVTMRSKQGWHLWANLFL